jgi:hypothetical protein
MRIDFADNTVGIDLDERRLGLLGLRGRLGGERRQGRNQKKRVEVSHSLPTHCMRLRRCKGRDKFEGRELRGLVLAIQIVQPVFVAVDPLLMDLGDMHQTGDAFHDLAQPPVALPVFRGHLPILCGEQFHAKSQGFVPLGQPLQSFINRHGSFLLYSFRNAPKQNRRSGMSRTGGFD